MQPLSPSPAPQDLWKEPVAVLGYGLEGRSTLAHLLRWGYRDLLVLDRTAPGDALPDGVRGIFGGDYLRGLEGARAAFRSPGLRPDLPEIAAFRNAGGVLTSQVEAAFRLAGRHRIIGVTGTVGKGTCCSLLSAMLERAGIAHRLAGNIGVPPLDALRDAQGELAPDALLLLELSSFQLSTLAESPALAIVLRTTSEHLDWHVSQKEYWDHKANLTRFQQPGDTCVYFAGAPGSRDIGARGAGRKLAVGAGVGADGVRLSETGVDWDEGGVHLTLAETKMTGAFNLENVGAAAAAARVLGAAAAAVRAGAREFSPLEHRIEFVREIASGGRRVRYYNDSYATRPEATVAAVRALTRAPRAEAAPADDVGLILGGSEKFADFSEMAAALADEKPLRAIALIGQTAPRLEGELRRSGALEGRAWRRCDTLEEALEFLRTEIRSGAILLSPACASFGLFANYKERGKAFKKRVNALPDALPD